MASIRIQGIDDKELKRTVEKFAEQKAAEIGKIGKEAMKNVRDQAVDSWYKKSTAANAMKDATEYDYSISSSGKNIEITIRSEVNISKFEALKQAASNRNYASPYANLARWREAHSQDGWIYRGRYKDIPDENLRQAAIDKTPHSALAMPYSIGEYLFNLPWNDGIVGLPPRETNTGTGWVNPKPARPREPLEQKVTNDINKKFAKELKRISKEHNI